MSHSVDKDVALFASSVPLVECEGYKDDELSKLIDPGSWADDFAEDSKKALASLEVNGWNLVNDMSKCCRSRNLYAPMWGKGKFRVWLLNESQYNNVGYYEITLVAEDEASFKEFVQDMKAVFPGRIRMQKFQAVVQWG